jgi:hypothetical protein
MELMAATLTAIAFRLIVSHGASQKTAPQAAVAHIASQ